MLRSLVAATLLAVSATAAPLLAYRATSPGCGKTQTSGYSAPITIQSGGRARSFKVQVPSSYNANAAYSLIVDFVRIIPQILIGVQKRLAVDPVYSMAYSMVSMRSTTHGPASCLLSQHGRGGSSDSQRDNSMYYNYAASSKYVIVYPQGIVGDSGAAWQGPSYATQGVDDVQFVADLLQYLKSNYCIDTDRVYASGKSNGGGFVDTLACSNTGDQFAAFAMAAAALYTDTSKESCSKKRAILESHGDNDDTIPYTGGQGSGGPIPDVGKWVRFWGERNCGVGAPSTRSTKNGYHIQTFSCNGFSNVVSHYHMYAPAGHCWPNSKGTNSDAKSIPSGCGNSKVLDYTPVVLDWFARWNLQNAPK